MGWSWSFWIVQQMHQTIIRGCGFAADRCLVAGWPALSLADGAVAAPYCDNIAIFGAIESDANSGLALVLSAFERIGFGARQASLSAQPASRVSLRRSSSSRRIEAWGTLAVEACLSLAGQWRPSEWAASRGSAWAFCRGVSSLQTCRFRELSMPSFATRTSTACPSGILLRARRSSWLRSFLLESALLDFAGANAWSLQTRQLGVGVSERRVSILRPRAITGGGPSAGVFGVCHPRSGHLAGAPASPPPPLTCLPTPPPSLSFPSSASRMLRSRASSLGRSVQGFRSLGRSSCLGTGRLPGRGLSALMVLSL